VAVRGVVKGFIFKEVSGNVTFVLIFSRNLAVMPKRLICIMSRSGSRLSELLTEPQLSFLQWSQCQESSSSSSDPVNDFKQSASVGLPVDIGDLADGLGGGSVGAAGAPLDSTSITLADRDTPTLAAGIAGGMNADTYFKKDS
jgi:hypothetical protein